jgi:hypothetical protein
MLINYEKHIFLGGNYSLESVDLSWNHIRGKGAIELIKGIRVNLVRRLTKIQQYERAFV